MNSFRRCSICSGSNVKLRTSYRSFLISEYPLNSRSASAVLALSRCSSFASFFPYSWIQGSSWASLAVGRFVGSISSNRFTNDFPESLTVSQISGGSKVTVPLRILSRTLINGSPSIPPNGVSPESRR